MPNLENRAIVSRASTARYVISIYVYLDTTLFRNTQYYYCVRAYNLGGTSDYYKRNFGENAAEAD